MDNDITLSRKLQEISENGNFDSLDHFSRSEEWKSLNLENRLLLGKLFVKKGELELIKGDVRFHESFALAEEIVPSNAMIHYLKGKAFSSQTENARCLAAAIESFEKSIAIDPTFFLAHFMLAEALIFSGLFHQIPQYFQKAQHKFSEAFLLLKDESRNIESCFFWRWGLSWYLMGIHSGEPFDFHQALQKYRQAQELGQHDADFYQGYAETLVELSDLVKQPSLCEEAVDYYHLAVCEDIENYDRWFRLASCHEKLYDMNAHPQHFELAQAAFDVASKQQEKNFFFWIRWGRLYLNAGKLQKNSTFLACSIEKFMKASQVDSDNAVLLGLWGEADMLYGMHTESLDLLRSAEQKIIRSIKQLQDNPHLWALYGTCLNELGRYFGDESYFIQAVDKFQHGLSINRQDPLLWYGLAISYFSIGEFWGDSQQIENAINCFQKVFDLGECTLPQFWNDWGLSLMKLSELTNDKLHLEAAIEKFEKIITKDTSTLEAEWLYNYGCALDFLGDFSEESAYYEKSIIALTRSLEIDPTYSNARYNLAVTLSHLGESLSDLDILRHSIEQFHILLNSDYEDEMAWNDCGLALLNMAELLQDEVDPEKCKSCYAEAELKFMHAIALGCTHSYYNLACLYSLQQNISSAMYYLERAEQAGTLPTLDDILHDEWMENLVETPDFRHFISYIASKQDPDSAEDA